MTRSKQASRAAGAVVLLAVSSGATACSSKDAGPTEAAKVCGVIDPGLVSAYLGTTDYTWNGTPTGSPTGPDCTVLRSGRSVLHAGVIRFADDQEARRSAAQLRSLRTSMRSSCPDPHFIDTWATANACVKAPGELSMTAATSVYDIQLGLTDPGRTVTVDQAAAIAQNIAQNMARS